MTYTTNQLISGAYNISGIVSKEFETVDGPEFADGLLWLNEILSEKTVQKGLIPYEGKHVFNAVIGHEEYFIDNLIDINTLTFVKEGVRFSMEFFNRDKYQGSSRANIQDSFPSVYYYERELGGARLFIYFPPDKAYEFTIYGIFRLSSVVAGQDLSLSFDSFYTAYLRSRLSERICSEYAVDLPINAQRELNRLSAFIDKRSRPMDLRLKTSSGLQNNKRGGWAYVNLYNGFSP